MAVSVPPIRRIQNKVMEKLAGQDLRPGWTADLFVHTEQQTAVAITQANDVKQQVLNRIIRSSATVCPQLNNYTGVWVNLEKGASGHHLVSQGRGTAVGSRLTLTGIIPMATSLGGAGSQ